MMRYVHVHTGTHVDAATINALLEEVYKANRENQRLKHAIEKHPTHKHTSPPSSSKKVSPRKVGYVCSNEEFFGLTVYENSNGRYVNDNGKRVDAGRFKISKRKPY